MTPPSPRRHRRVLAAVAVLTAVLVVAAGVAWFALRPAPPPPQPVAGDLRATPRFAPDSAFTLDVSTAPLDPRSDALVRHLTDQITPHYSGIAALNVYDYSASLYVVDSSTPKHTVEFYDCQKKGYTPPNLHDGTRQFVDVPIPDGALVASGTDKALSLWSPSTDQLWEFWVMEKTGTGWRACWGGRIDGVSTNKGVFTHPYGATATGIPMVGTMVSVQDVASLNIEHAMGIALLSPADASRVRYPALRSDGGDTSPDAIPEGSRLRLDPSLDVDTLGLTPTGTAIARAAQRYGFIVVDRAGAVAVIGQSGLPEKAATGTNPWDVMLTPTPSYQQLENFPWDRMQVLREDVGRPADAPTATP